MKKSQPAGGLLLYLMQKLTHICKHPGHSKKNRVSSHGCENSCQPLTDIQASLAKLEIGVRAIKEQLQQLQSALEAPKDGIENFTVERMYVDKFELNVESIDVETVSGTLNVGITHSSMVGMAQPGGTGAPGAGHQVKTGNLRQIINEHLGSGQQSPRPAAQDLGEKKYTRTFYPNQGKPKIMINRVN